jgi:hypothetical protein
MKEEETKLKHTEIGKKRSKIEIVKIIYLDYLLVHFLDLNLNLEYLEKIEL